MYMAVKLYNFKPSYLQFCLKYHLTDGLYPGDFLYEKRYEMSPKRNLDPQLKSHEVTVLTSVT